MIKKGMNMKKLSGQTLIEVLIALCALGIIVPTSFGAFGNILTASLRVNERAYMISAAEWWFNRLTFPVHKSDIDAAPRVDRHGKARFDWDTEFLHTGTLYNSPIQVTLRVYGRLPAPPFTVSRIF